MQMDSQLNFSSSQQNSFENLEQLLKESMEAPRSQIVLKICYLLQA